ncbi:helix-turn-helix transcriptional regulator [Paraburkholderia bryophila]|uniref:AlpA family transcriptional regulator n=1 Tax=Paraburkholderia bryophila TaxID=420952 RepID=A0A329CAN2_9BURK|nr:AlpA family phage regulatory protein [Paraburkholderia bryophila]RAS32046.1 AlpA family transcriptional regulator [Paraburkholderia bryophila]
MDTTIRAPKVVAIPETGFMRFKQVQQVFPIGRTTLWELVGRGLFPQPIRMSSRLVVWRAEEVRAWIVAQGQQKTGIVAANELGHASTGRPCTAVAGANPAA